MKINNSFYTQNIYPKKQPAKHEQSTQQPREVSFGAQNPQKTPHKSFLNKFKPYALAGLIMYGGLNACTNNRISGKEDINGITVEYFDISPETKDSILAPLCRLKSKLTPENDFLEGLQLDLANTYDDLDNANSFREYIKSSPETNNEKGCSFYSDKRLPRRIAIQESAHKDDKILNFIRKGEYTNFHALKQTIMHETGHQFDKFFGHNHNAKFAQKWDEIQEESEKSEYLSPYETPLSVEKQKAKILFDWNCALSDKPEFHEAMLKDLKHIANLKQNNPEKLARNIDYYLTFVDLSQEITPHIVDLADGSRSEVYANLFSYAMGEDEGDKSKFTENFKNSYKIVKQNIKDKLDINVE